MTERSPKPLTASIQRCSFTNMLKINLFVRWIFFAMAGLKCLQLRYQMTWLIWDNFIGSQSNAWKCLALVFGLYRRYRNRRSQCSLSNLLCREYIIWDSREKSSDEICFTDIGVTMFFYFARRHYNVVKIWCKSGRRRTVRNPMVGADFAVVWHFLIQIM